MKRIKERKCMRSKKYAGVIFCSILCLVMLFSGCGQVEVPQDLMVPAISVTGQGEVTAYIVEDFDKDYYDLAELRTMVEDELSKFNEIHKNDLGMEAVRLTSLTVAGEVPKAVLVLIFRDTSCYKDYFGKDLFYGTVAQAQESGYDLDVELVAVKDGKIIGKKEIFGMGSSRLLIVSDDVRIYGPGKPQYVTSKAAVNEDGSVEPSDTEDNTYIIMK